MICAFAIGAAAVLGWLLATFAVRPFRRLAAQTRMIDAGDEAPGHRNPRRHRGRRDRRGHEGHARARVWEEQDRTKAALTSARDFAAASAHELRTPLTAMRTNLEVLSTLELPDEQRNEVLHDVIRTQSRIETTLWALERLAQGELTTDADHVPVDITELLDRAAHDAMRVYPELDVSLVPAPTVIIVGLPAGLRLAVDNAIANAVKHGNATHVELSAVSSRAGVEIADRRRRIGCSGGGTPTGVRAIRPRVDGVALRLRDSGWRWSPSKPKYTAAQPPWRTAALGGDAVWCCGCPALGDRARTAMRRLCVAQPAH